MRRHDSLIVRPLLPLAIVACTTMGCSDPVSSQGIPTENMSIQLAGSIFEQSDFGVLGVKVRDEVGGDRVQLSGDEALTARLDGGDAIAMEWDDGRYTTELPLDVKAIVVSYTRVEGTSAPSTAAEIPEPLEVDPPLDNATVTHGEDFVATVLNPVDASILYADAISCEAIGAETPIEVSVDSQLVLPSSLLSPSAPPAGGQCVEVTIRRLSTAGTVDPAFNVGESEVTMERYESFTLTVVP